MKISTAKNLTAPLGFNLEHLICFALTAVVLSLAQTIAGPLPKWPTLMLNEVSTLFVEWNAEIRRIFDF